MKRAARQPFFCFCRLITGRCHCLRRTKGVALDLTAKLNKLEEILRPVVEGLGYEYWGLEFRSHARSTLLRVFIDDPDKGISVDDCEKVSRQVSAVMDVEDPIQNEYTLEVSSPGMDRPLFTLEQFEAWAGHQVSIRLRMAFEGRRRFQGILKGTEAGDVVVVVDDHEYLLPFESIDKANIVPVFE